MAMLRMRLRLLDEQLQPQDIYVYEQDGLLWLSDNLSEIEGMNLTYMGLDELDYSIYPADSGDIMNISGWDGIEGYGDVERAINLSLGDSYMRLKLSELSATRALDSFEGSLDNYSGRSDVYYFYLKAQKQNFDVAVGLVDEVKLMLDADISATEEYIAKIDSGVVKIEAIQAELNSSVKAFSRLDPAMAEKLITPFIQDYEPILPGISNIQQAYPGMIAIIVIFISILFANIVTLSEVNSKAFFRNLLAPVSRLTFVFGLVITTLVIVFFQIFVLLLVGQFSFGIDVFSGFGSLALIIVMLSLFFLMLGMIIAILVRSEQSSVLTTTFVALGFFLFSNSVTPIEIMPKLAGVFASLNPYVIATTAFRKVLIFNLGPQLLMPELLQLGAYLTVGLVVLVLVSLRKLKN